MAVIAKGTLIMTIFSTQRSKQNKQNKKRTFTQVSLCTLSFLLPFSQSVSAADIEITPLLGYTFSPDLVSSAQHINTDVSNTMNLGLAIAWEQGGKSKRKNTGQGQVLINYIDRDFTSKTDNNKHSFDTLYAHFNGVTFIDNGSHITTIGFGFGGTYFKSDSDSSIYPSLTAAVGTRHAITDNLNFVTEVRAYATLVKTDDSLFCHNGTCIANFDRSFWLDSQLSIGLAYQF